MAIAADATGLRAQAAGLRSASDTREGRAAAATLELYSLQAELGRAQTELAGIRSRRAALVREQASARTQLTVAKQAVLHSQTQLADLVRALYQGDGNDPLAVVLGAGSLEQALAGLDSISRAAGQNNRIVEQAREARMRLAGLATRLAEREGELSRLAEAAAARTESLAAAAGARRQLIGSLRRQQDLTAARIGSIESDVRAAEERTTALAAAAPQAAPIEVARPLAAVPVPLTLTVSSTGYSIRGRTATAIPTGPGVVAVDPSVIPLGTRLTIPGYGVAIAADTGGAVQGNTIDVWFPTEAQALQWGRRAVTITLH